MLANKSRRFTEVPSDTPGPGSYNLSKQKDWTKDGGCIRDSASAPTKLSIGLEPTSGQKHTGGVSSLNIII